MAGTSCVIRARSLASVGTHRANSKLEGRRLDAIARERLVEPVDAAIELILAGGASIVSFNMDERDIRIMPVLDAERKCRGLLSLFKLS